MSQTGTDEAAQVQPKTKMRIRCEVYSRIVGYIRPTDKWNDGKRQEFADRVAFDVDKVIGDENAN